MHALKLLKYIIYLMRNISLLKLIRKYLDLWLENKINI